MALTGDEKRLPEEKACEACKESRILMETALKEETSEIKQLAKSIRILVAASQIDHLRKFHCTCGKKL